MLDLYMADSSIHSKDLLFIDSFREKVDYPGRVEGQFFEIYWTLHTPQPSLLGHEIVPPKGEWIYLVGPFEGYQFEMKDTKGTFLRFHRGLLNLESEEFSLEILRIFNFSKEPTSIFVPQEEVAVLDELIHLMKRELSRRPRDFMFLKSLLKSFLLKLVSLSEENYRLPDLNAKRVYHFLMLVESHYKETRQTSFYADKLNLSTKRLNQILKEHMGATIGQLLQERVIMEAKRKLYQGQDNIKEIGSDLGYADQSYFSRFFRNMTGRSPEEFRDDIQSRL